MEIKYGEQEIRLLLEQVRRFDRTIGSYEFFTISHSFEYLVKVSNGTLLFKVSELRDAENSSASEQQLKEIAGRFLPDGMINPRIDPVASRSGMKSGIVLMVIVVALVAGGIIIAALRNNKNSKRVYLETKVAVPAGSSQNPVISSRDQQQVEPGPEEKRMQQREIEMRDPFRYLSLKTSYRLTIINNIVVEGSLKSNASVANYRNVTIRVKFYSKKGELLGEEDHKLPDILTPGQETAFSFKVKGWFGKTEKAVHEIIAATPY